MIRSREKAEHLVATGEDHREGVRHPDRQQAHLRDAHRPGGRRQRHGGLRPLRRRPWTRRPRPWASTSSAASPPWCRRALPQADRKLIRSIPEALAATDLRLLLRERRLHQGRHQHGRRGGDGPRHQEDGRPHCRLTAASAAPSSWSSANAVEDNPFMAGAFHGVGEPECVINVGVSGPGVVHHALQQVKGAAV